MLLQQENIIDAMFYYWHSGNLVSWHMNYILYQNFFLSITFNKILWTDSNRHLVAWDKQFITDFPIICDICLSSFSLQVLGIVPLYTIVCMHDCTSHFLLYHNKFMGHAYYYSFACIDQSVPVLAHSLHTHTTQAAIWITCCVHSRPCMDLGFNTYLHCTYKCNCMIF